MSIDLLIELLRISSSLFVSQANIFLPYPVHYLTNDGRYLVFVASDTHPCIVLPHRTVFIKYVGIAAFAASNELHSRVYDNYTFLKQFKFFGQCVQRDH
jgi:hypothetical protein